MSRIQATADQRFAPLVDRYVAKTRASRALASRYRPVLADIRIGNRFAPGWKELIYPIVCARSNGSRLWDVDGNEYIDLTCGFGVHMFGHNPPFVQDALHDRLRSGTHLGAENELPGEVAQLLADLTEMERVAFVNTGSEAVHSALRFARAATGRSRIAMFRGSYHGWYDGVLAIRDEDGRTRPDGPGIPDSSVTDILLLDFDTPDSLDRLAEAGESLAAILVEPVQSRRPDVQPRAFLHGLRRVADATGSTLIFDEMVTGFRLASGGAQEVFDVRADLAAYGKLIGAGMPIGVVAGQAKFLDTVDGGAWTYGDESAPQVPQTVFAGTYSRHPLAMAAAREVLGRLRDEEPTLQDELSRRTAELSSRLAEEVTGSGLPFRVTHCASMFRLDTEDRAIRELLSYHLILRGLFVCETSTWFLSTAHDDSDCDAIVEAVADALAEIREVWQ